MTSTSGVLLPPCEMLLVVVTTSAMLAASQILTYTWLLSMAGVANIRNRVCPGAYGPVAAQAPTSGTAYWLAANCALDNSEREGDPGSSVAVAGFT